MSNKVDSFGTSYSLKKINEAVKAALKCNRPAVIDVAIDPKALYSFRRDTFKYRNK